MKATLACIGGMAAYDLLREGALVAKRLGARNTPFGESQPLYLCESRFGDFYFLSRHGESGFEVASSFINYRANIYALKDLGVRSIVSWSETRAINHNFDIGQYVIVDDLIDETHLRPNTFFENRGLGVVRQWPVFCPSLRKAFAGTLELEGCNFDEQATYVCIEGPRRETPAETHKFALNGGELLGMTLAPEVFLAKELQLCYAGLCIVSGYAETGSDFRPFENGRVLDEESQKRRTNAALERLPRLLERLTEVLQSTPCVCRCESSMQHHIAEGQITWDWRTWFEELGPFPTQDRRHEAGTAEAGDYEYFWANERRRADRLRAESEVYDPPVEDGGLP